MGAIRRDNSEKYKTVPIVCQLIILIPDRKDERRNSNKAVQPQNGLVNSKILYALAESVIEQRVAFVN